MAEIKQVRGKKLTTFKEAAKSRERKEASLYVGFGANDSNGFEFDVNGLSQGDDVLGATDLGQKYAQERQVLQIYKDCVVELDLNF